MMSSRRRLLVALTIGSAIAVPIWGAAAPAAPADDMSLGNPKAKVTVIEYASASCPHCAHFNNEIFPAFRAKYIDTGKVHFVFREFLTAPAEVAAASFLLARCAGKDKYFSVLDAIFRGQQQMYATGDVSGALLRAAKDAGMDASQAQACVDNPTANQALEARVQRYAKDDGISMTPTFVVNGKKLEGAPTLADLDTAIAAAR
jgi:protein-disulfide isomerase